MKTIIYKGFKSFRIGGLLSLACFCLLGTRADAQVQPEYAKNTGASVNNTFTWGGGSSSKRSQQLYRSSDFSPAIAPGKIHKLYFMYGSSGNTVPTTYANLVVKMGHTADTSYADTMFYTGLTTVLSASSYTVQAGAEGTWFEVPLQVPFDYDTSQSLIVEIYFDSYVNSVASAGLGTFTGPVVNGRKLTTTSLTAVIGTRRNNLPNMGLQIVSQVSRNAAISKLVSPVNYCAGNHNVVVDIRNYGTSRINSLAIDWEVNGTPRSRVNYNTPIDTVNSAGGHTALVTLGSVAFTSAPHTIRAWIAQVDGQSDLMNGDDTLTVTLRSSASGTFTVNRLQPTGATNFSSFRELADLLNTVGVCGPVVVNVEPNSGPYEDTFYLREVPGVSATNWIRINANGNTLQSDQRPMVLLSGMAHTRIDSLTLRSLDVNYTAGVCIMKESHHDSITNCFFDFSSIDNSSSGNYAVAFTNSLTLATTAGTNGSHCYIAGNRIFSSGDKAGAAHGISVAGASDSNIIVNNLIENGYNFGIYISGATGTLVADNEIHRSAKNDRVTTYHAIYTTGEAPGTRIIGNRIHDPVGPAPTSNITAAFNGLRLGASATASDPAIVTNNIIYGVNWPADANGIYLEGAAYHKVYHNTVAIDKLVSGNGTHVGLYAKGANTGAEFKNNIISITAGSTGEKYGFYFESPSEDAMADMRHNNIYVRSTQTGPQYYAFYNGKAFSDRTSFRAAYPGVEPISLEAEPRFVNAATGNLAPTNQALQGVGLDLSATVPSDITGAVRGKAATPGAYELTAPAGGNARVAARVTPEGYFCNGPQEVKVALQNSGTTAISSVQLQWSLNGAVQTPVTYTGSLAAPGGSGLSMDTVTLGTVNIPGGDNDLKVWTVLAGDVNNINDTLIETVATAMSGNYTINAATPTGGTNFKSFNDFSDALYQKGVCGPVEVDVLPGIYNEAVTFRDHPGAGPGNPVRINGHGQRLFYATGTGSNDIRHLLTLSGTKYMRIDSMVLFTASDRGWGTWITGGAMYDSITNCRYDMTTITATAAANGTGIAFSSSTSSPTGSGVSGKHCYIAGNHMQGPVAAGGPYYGVSMGSGGNDSNIIVNNIFENILNTGVYLSSTAGTLVQGNEIHRSTKQVASVLYGVSVLGASPGTRVIGNKIHSPVTDTVTAVNFNFRGINVGSSGAGTAQDPLLLANNVIYNINMGSTSGAGAQGIYLDGASHVKVYHNTVAFNAAYTGAGTNVGIYATGTLGNVAIRNNIVSITKGGTGIKYGFFYNTAQTVNGITAERNNFHVASTQIGAQNYGYATTAYATQGAFQTVYPTMEGGSLTVNPQFANLVTGYLMPTNQALQGNGVNLLSEVPEDIAGNPRSAVPTPGAYEIPATAGYNAGVDALASPGLIVCPGQHEIKVVVLNAGSFPISNMEVQWTFNGAAQPVYNYSGTLDVPGGAGGNTDTITIGMVNILPGANVLRAWTVVANDVNHANDTLEITIKPTDFNLFAGSDSVCTGSGAYMRIEPYSGYDDGMLQWESSVNGTTFTPLAGTDTVVYTTAPLSANTWYRVHIGSGTSGCYSDTLAIRVVDPVLTGTAGNTRCGTGTTTLSATASPGSTVKWYASATGGVPLATGSTFTTPVVSGNTTFYAAAALGNGRTFNLGPLNPAAVGTSTSTNNLPNWVVYFTVHQTTVLQSVDIFPTAASVGKSSALRIVNMADNSEVRQIPYTASVAGTTTSGQTVIINQKLPPGNYSIGLADNVVSLMLNSQSGGVYPYASDELSITGHNFTSNPNYYWFFYNWKIGYGCETPRQAINVTVTTPPSVSLSASKTTVCAGDTVSLSASSGNSGYSYTWRPGNLTGSTVSVAPVSSTTYYLTALDNSSGPNSGCVLEDSIDIHVNPLPPATVTPNGATTFCEGGSVTLLANTGVGYNYQWYRNNVAIAGSTNSTYTANSSGSYSVAVTGNNQCSAMSAPVTVTVHLAPQPTITEDGGILSTGTYAQYQWRRNGTPIQGATNRSYTPTASDVYTVTVTDDNGCSATSTPHYFNRVSVGGLSGNRHVRIYPNPTSDVVYIEAPESVRVTLSSPEGRTILLQQHVQSLQVGDLPDGVYLLRIYNENGDLLKMERLTKFSR
jgi:parallel beta-helix repeat protein